MKIYCIIAARGGSKSIIDKNIQRIGDKTLLEIAIDKAEKIKLYNKIFISSDSIKYQKYVKQSESVEFILRPENIAQDNSTELEYLQHVVSFKNLKNEDYLARMQCTSPFQRINSMVKVINTVINLKCDSAQLITESSPSIYKALSIDNNNKLKPATKLGNVGPTNRQNLPKAYYRSNFYVTKVCNILNNNIMGENSIGVLGEDIERIDIDNKLDLEVARSISKIYTLD